jgi:hypothetical protein
MTADAAGCGGLAPDELTPWAALDVTPTLAELEAEAQAAPHPMDARVDDPSTWFDASQAPLDPPVDLSAVRAELEAAGTTDREVARELRNVSDEEREEKIALAATWRSGVEASAGRAGFDSIAEYLDVANPVAFMAYVEAERQRRGLRTLAETLDVIWPLSNGRPAVGTPSETTRRGRVVLTLAELLAAEIPTPPSRVAGLLPGEGFGILAGPRKHGKTLTELQLGLCVAGGVPFLGRAVTQTPVLLIEEEGAARAMQDRLRVQAEALGVSADAPLHIAHRQRFRLDHPADVAAIDELIHATGAGLVIIGPLAQVAAIDENSNSTDGMGPIVRTMTDLAARHRALVKLVHHLRKPAGAPQAPKSVDEFFYRVRGADALVAGVDVALGLWREPEATEGTLYVLARDGENVRIPLLFDARSLTFAVNPDPDDPMAADVARFVECLARRPGRWHPRAELEGATGWGKTKVLSVGLYAFGEKRAEQRTVDNKGTREWRVSEPSLGGAG